MDSVIFDVDGTLWDSRIPVAKSWNASLEAYTGRPSTYTVEYLGSLFGRTMDDIAAALLPDATREEQLAFGEECFQAGNRYLEREHGTLYPGVKETLAELAKKYPLYIVSNCQSGYIEVMMKTTGLEEYFSGHLCYGDTGEGKGKNLVTLCRRYGLRNPIYVGDTQGDANACAEAGMPMIWAAYGMGTVKQPQTTIQSFAELLDIL